jgi:hypothetical protein
MGTRRYHEIHAKNQKIKIFEHTKKYFSQKKGDREAFAKPAHEAKIDRGDIADLAQNDRFRSNKRLQPYFPR